MTVAATAGLALVGAACSSSLPSSVASAPVLSVATGLWPLAQMASAIGGNKVAVVDVVPPGTDPLTFRPDPAQTRVLAGAGLVLEVGGGFQPALEAAAAGARAVGRIGPGPGRGNPYVWLDPTTMKAAINAIADAMAAANRPAASLYRRNAGAVQDEVRSLSIDYSSTLSTCPGTTLLTPDRAFATMAADYGLTDHVIGPAPTGAQIASEKDAIERGGAVAALREPWVDSRGVEAVAATARIKVHDVDTLAGVPSPAGTAGGYFAYMERNLGVLSSALGCNSSEQ